MAGHWVLVGLMGSGKSTIGERLAAHADREFVDNDALLFDMTQRTTAELQQELGRDELHRLERTALAAALSREEPAVIAAAASVVDDAEMRARLRREAIVVWLDVDVRELAQRVRRQSHRPLDADPLPQLEAQHREREAALREVADIIVTAADSPDAIVERLADRLRGS